jgi:hypothetical protein
MARPSTPQILAALLSVLAVAATVAKADDAPGVTPDLNATANAAANGTAPPAGPAGAAAAAYCPASWPAAPAGSLLVYLSMGFNKGSAADCGRPGYPGGARRASAYAAKALARMVKMHDGEEGDVIHQWASFQAVKAGSSCQARRLRGPRLAWAGRGRSPRRAWRAGCRTA